MVSLRWRMEYVVTLCITVNDMYVRIVGSWANHCKHKIIISLTIEQYWVAYAAGWRLMVDVLLGGVTRPRCILSFRNFYSSFVRSIGPSFHCFLKKEADTIPIHCSYDHIIKIKDGYQPLSAVMYGMSQDKIQELRWYLEENLAKGFIWASQSHVAAPVLSKMLKGMMDMVRMLSLLDYTRRERAWGLTIYMIRHPH